MQQIDWEPNNFKAHFGFNLQRKFLSSTLAEKIIVISHALSYSSEHNYDADRLNTYKPYRCIKLSAQDIFIFLKMNDFLWLNDSSCEFDKSFGNSVLKMSKEENNKVA